MNYDEWIRPKKQTETKPTEQKEMVNSPAHYNHYSMETIDMMVRIFGVQRTIEWCEMTAFKYRMRLGLKDDINQDLAKETWYLNKAEELKKSL